MQEFDFKQYAHLTPQQQIEEYHKFHAQQSSQKQQESVKQEKTVASNLLNKIGNKTEFKVDERVYTIAHWSPTKVYRNIPKVGRYFIIPISTIIGEIANTPKGEEVDLSEAIPTALMYLFQTMDDNDIMDFYNVILDDVYFDGKPVMSDFDNIFSENTFDVIDIVAEVIRINYVVPFSQKKGLSSLTNLVNVAKPMMEIANLE